MLQTYALLARRSRLILDPRKSRVLLPMWDATTTLALLFTLIVTPGEVAFRDDDDASIDVLFVVNRVVAGPGA